MGWLGDLGKWANGDEGKGALGLAELGMNVYGGIKTANAMDKQLELQRQNFGLMQNQANLAEAERQRQIGKEQTMENSLNSAYDSAFKRDKNKQDGLGSISMPSVSAATV